jgi:hypothetical protein
MTNLVGIGFGYGTTSSHSRPGSLPIVIEPGTYDNEGLNHFKGGIKHFWTGLAWGFGSKRPFLKIAPHSCVYCMNLVIDGFTQEMTPALT